jgi:Lrp/AsnC family leucine-responsive transcriptional regulator
MKKDIDRYDNSILWNLDIDSRKSFSEIAKSVRLSKQSVKARIRKMEESGLIKGYRMIGNLSRLGFSYYRLHIKFIGADVKSIAEKMSGNARVNWVARCEGRYDLLVGILGKDEMDVEKTVNELLSPYSGQILDYDFVTVTKVAFFNRGYWIGKKEEGMSFMVGPIKREPEKIDDKDRDILSGLSGNARTSLKDLAKSVGLTPEAVSYRVRRFEKSGLIAKYFLLLDHKKVQTQLYKALVYLKPLNEEKEKELISLVGNNPFIFDYVKTLAPWQLEIDLEARDPEHYHEMMKAIVSLRPGQDL